MDNLFLDLTTSLLNLIKPLLAALSPLIIGLVLAYLLNTPVSWLESKIKSRGISILITYLVVAAILCGMIYGFVILIIGALPQGGLVTTVQLVKDYFYDAMTSANSFIARYLPQISPDLPSDTVEKLQNWFSSRFSAETVISAISSATGSLISFFIGAVASIYLLKDKEFFIGLWEKFMVLVLHQRTHGIVSEITGEIHVVVTTFIKGAFIDGIIVAFLSSFILTLLKVNFAVIIGIMGGLLNIIPYFGPFISMVPAFFAAFFSGGPIHGLAAAAGLFLVQQLDSNYIYPKIVGSTIGLHPLFVLLAVSISGYFFGIPGMLLAVPTAGILQILISRWAYSRK